MLRTLEASCLKLPLLLAGSDHKYSAFLSSVSTLSSRELSNSRGNIEFVANLSEEQMPQGTCTLVAGGCSEGHLMDGWDLNCEAQLN